ncbi:hypothetical protein EDC04DRAFT_3144183 [Pisolithus marmoratus]|nr:hypothetical protein EDC04DRAFT_3144183 [Pisolithus marmoratus]
MQNGPSYSTQSSNVHVLLEHFPPPFSRGIVCSQKQQECDPYHVPYGAPRYCSVGEDLPRQNRTPPSLSARRPVTLSEYNRHFRNRLTRAVALAPALGTYGTRDYPRRADDVKNAEASMAHTLDQGVGNPVSSWSTQPVGDNGQSSMVPSIKLPPHNADSPPINDTVQIRMPIWIAEHGHANPINLGTLRGHRQCRNVRTFCDTDEWRLPLPYMAPPSGHVLTGRDPPPILPNSANDTAVNMGTKPFPLGCTAPQPGRGDDYQWVNGNYCSSSRVTPSSHPNAPWHQQPSYRLHHHEIEYLSVRERSPEANHSHTGILVNAPAACKPSNHTAPKHCGWRDNGDRVCDMLVTYDGLARHLAKIHNIKDIASDAKIECRWCFPGKIVSRKNVLRHLREKHLLCPRRKKRAVQLPPQFPPMTPSHNTLNAGTPVELQAFTLSYLPCASFPTRASSQ